MVRVQPGVLKLLLYLVSREGHVVSKSELVDAVWAGQAVSDTAIYNRVTALRKALLDSDGPERCIRWEYGSGVRFLRPQLDATAEPRAADVPVRQSRPDDGPTSTGAVGRFAGSTAVADWRHVLGIYHLYYRTPSWPGAIKVGVSVLVERDGLVRVRTIEQGTDAKHGIRQNARYHGHAEFIDGRVYIFEQNRQPPRSVCLTVLDAPHSYNPDLLTGMMMGSSWRVRGAPYTTRVVWRRVPPGMSLRDAVRRSGPRQNGEGVDQTIQDSIGLSCLTFNEGDSVVPGPVPSEPVRPPATSPSRQAQRDGPSTVAILPFHTLAGDSTLHYLANNIATDTAAQLSRFREVRVAAGNLTFSTDSDASSAKQLAAQLGVRYVIGGGLRSAEDGLRLTAHLIDTLSETQIWANTYELASARISENHDKITRSIVASVATVLRDDQLATTNLKDRDALNAWECYLRGSSIMHTFDADAQAEAIALFEHGIRLEPEMPDLYAALSYALKTQSRLPKDLGGATASGNRRTAVRLHAHDLAKRALEIDSRVPFAWLALGRSHLGLGEFDSAILALERALALNPNLGWAHFMLGYCYWPMNRVSEAMDAFDMALETLIEERCQWTVIAGKACALMAAGRFDEAVEAARRAQIDPRADQFAYCPEICSLSHLGHRKEAQLALRKASANVSNFGFTLIEFDQPLPDPKIRKLIVDGLNRAETA